MSYGYDLVTTTPRGFKGFLTAWDSDAVVVVVVVVVVVFSGGGSGV